MSKVWRVVMVIVMTAMRKQFNVPAKLGSNYVKEE